MLAVLIMVLGVVGSYSLRNNMTDVIFVFFFSFVGYFFTRFNYSTSSFVLGLILGSILENAMRKQLIVSEGQWIGFFTRPISLIILLLALIAFISPHVKKFLARKDMENAQIKNP